MQKNALRINLVTHCQWVIIEFHLKILCIPIGPLPSQCNSSHLYSYLNTSILLTLSVLLTVVQKNPIKNAISPCKDASGKKVLMLLSALVERFGVSHMRDFSSELLVFF